MYRSISVPKRVAAEVVGSSWKLMVLSVHSSIGTVDIIEDRRSKKTVVQRAVEDLSLLFRAALHSNLGQFPFPLARSLIPNPVEIPPGDLSIEIAHRALRAYPGNTRLNQNHFIFVG
jgi:hypothetical protein